MPQDIAQSERRHWRPGTPAVDSHAFDGEVVAGKLTFVHFWAEWNGTDRAMDQHIEVLRRKYAQVARFYSLDVDLPENAPIARRFQLGNVPTLLCFSKGELRGSVVGLWPAKELDAFIRQMISTCVRGS
jgi:thioredoxin 1